MDRPIEDPCRLDLTTAGNPICAATDSSVAGAINQSGVGTAGGPEKLLRDILVHGHGAGGMTAAGIGQTGQIQHGLDGSILTRAAVQGEEDDIGLAEQAFPGQGGVAPFRIERASVSGGIVPTPPESRRSSSAWGRAPRAVSTATTS